MSARSLLPMGVLLLALATPGAASEAEPNTAAVLPLLAELRAREVELDKRERAIAERERNQAELERLVQSQLAEIAGQHELLSSRIEAWEAQSGTRIRRLAKIYGAMDPGKAARLLEGLEANLATQILSKMKPKKSAAVLERIEADRALTVSRQVAHPLSFEPADPEAGEIR